MASFTCISCGVLFKNADFQREHYKTDWHRYNLKRKLVELPPVTEDDFKEKIAFQAQQKQDKVNEKISTFCKVCNKSFASPKAYENHIKSNKHKQVEEKAKKNNEGVCINKNAKKSRGRKTFKPKPGYMPPISDVSLTEDDSDEWEDIEEEEVVGGEEYIESTTEESEALPQTVCLFCCHESRSVEDNVSHMSKAHSFFIPDLEYITDIEAFLIYLGAKVGDGKVCLLCNNHSKQFRLLSACQSHMIDKGHCTLDYEGDAMLEYADFYDFAPSYPDHSEDTDIDSEIFTKMNELSIDKDTMELILPSGSRIGHRALKRYYDQNLPEEAVERKNRAMITGVNSHYKALGLHGTTLAVAMRKQIVARKAENFKRSYDRMKLGVKANKLQKYFRLQVMYAG